MLARTFAVAIVVLCGLVTVTPVAGQQDYASGRPSFTLGEKLQQWGSGLFGGPPNQSPRTASSTNSAARSAGNNRVNHPNYHRHPGSGNASSGSSRRTAQPSYQPAETAPANSEPEEEALVQPIPAAPAPPRTAGIARSSPKTSAPKSSSPKSTAANVQPRTLQEALFNSRTAQQSSAPDSPPARSSRNSATTESPTPAAPRVASSPTPARPTRSPEALEQPSADSEPALEDPLPAAPVTPVAPRVEKQVATNRTAETLLFTQKSPVLAVEATGPRRTAVGRETKFKIAVRNTGDVSARDVLLVVQLPEGTEVTSAHPTIGEARLPASGDAANSVLRWSVSEVPARSQEELELRVVPRKNEAFDLSVQWTFAPDTQQIVVDVQEPKLQMQLAGPKEVSFGEKAVYKLTFSNPGDADAENVVVTLPAIGTGEGPADSHTIGTIRAGESKVVEMELVARQMGRLAIKAQATADAGLQASVSQEVTVRRAGIAVELEGPKTGFARTSAPYKVIVSNNGNAAAADVQVAVQLPPRAKYVSSSDGGQSSGERITWKIDSLEPGQEQVLDFKCQLENAGVNRLQAAAVYGDLKDLATLNTEVEAVADLTLSVVEPAGVFAVGEDVTYEVHIKNRGTTSAEGINVVAFFSDGLEAVSASGARYEVSPGKIQFGTIPTLAADKELVLKIRARADQAGNHVFRAEALCTALGAKLAQEGTTRFYAEGSSDKQPAKPETEGASPAPGNSIPENSDSASSGTDDRTSRWSGSSRRRGAPPADRYAPEGTGELR